LVFYKILAGVIIQNIIQDIANLIQDNPDFNLNWDDFLSSDAGRMMVELFAYITDQLATRIDWVVNESWIGTATQKRSIMRILKLIGYQFTLPIASKVSVEIDLSGDTYPGEFYLTEVYTPSTRISFSPFFITANDKKGNSRRYELLVYDEDNEKYEYKTGVKIESETSTHNFYEGRTYIEEFTVDTDNFEVFELTYYPVINNSIRVYFVDESNPSSITEEELLLVESFLDADAQRILNTSIQKNVMTGNDGGSVSVGSISIVEPASYGVNSYRELSNDIKILKEDILKGFGVFRYNSY